MQVNMKNHRYLSVILILMYMFDCIYSVNLEELKLLNCKVDIQETPIKKGEEPLVPVIHVPSADGQEYSCLLPQVEEENVTESALDEESIREVTTALESRPCLSSIQKEADWWTVKICWGRNIEQYHVQDGRITSYVITLGEFENYGWSNDTDQRYLSLFYANGTECGYFGPKRTGLLRTTEVRLYCEEDVQDYILAVEEPVTCTYIITVHTSLLCPHRQFKAKTEKEEKSVPCHPLLDDEQDSDYME